ncbi:hypothetical protein BH23BAC4_BH23BAC4_07330 [soil metagenome]
MRAFSLVAALLLFGACAEPHPDSPTFGEDDAVVDDFAFDDQRPDREAVTTEAQLMGTYDCQVGPGFVEFTRRGQENAVIAHVGDQPPLEGTWSVTEAGLISVQLGGETQEFTHGEFEDNVLTLTGRTEGPGQTWVCGRTFGEH